MPFRRDRLVVVAPADHALAARDVTDFRRCLAYDFVGLNRGSSLLDTSRARRRTPACRCACASRCAASTPCAR